MSPTPSHALIIEWAPDGVRVVCPTTGEIAAAANLAGIPKAVQRGKRALVAVSRGCVFVRLLHLPKASHEDLRKLVAAQMPQHFPLPASELSFDVVQTTERAGDGFLTLVAAMRTADLSALTRALREAGITASRILPAALAAPPFAAAAGHRDALVIERSSAGLTMDVVQEGVVRLSRTVASDEDPAGEAAKTLGAAGAGSLPILCAGGLDIPGASAQPGTVVEHLGEVHHFQFDLPEERAKAARSRAIWRQRIAASMAIGAVALCTAAWLDHSQAVSAVSQTEGRLAASLSKLRREQTAQSVRLKQAKTVQTAIRTAFEPGQTLTDVVGVVSDRLPSGVWLTGLSVERGKPIQLRGTASRPAQVAGLVGQLSGSPRIADARLLAANTAKIEQTPVVQFTITASGPGNTPLPAPPKKTKTKAKRAGAKATKAAEGTTL